MPFFQEVSFQETRGACSDLEPLLGARRNLLWGKLILLLPQFDSAQCLQRTLTFVSTFRFFALAYRGTFDEHSVGGGTPEKHFFVGDPQENVFFQDFVRAPVFPQGAQLGTAVRVWLGLR